jgi:hypothetical protein
MYLIAACLSLVLAGSATSSDASPSGVMEGRLKVLSSKPVDIGDENAATVTAEDYSEYPTAHLEPKQKKRNCADYCEREWRLSRCAAARRLYSGRARAAA